MFDSSKESVIVFVVSVVILLLLFCAFIIMIIYKYQQRQVVYFKEMEQLKATYENTLLQSQLEIQEQTFQYIAREIHDNIGQKLTLAKLYLNTLPYEDIARIHMKVGSSLDLISVAISDLSDISRGMSTDVIINNGLVKVIELEVIKLQKTGLYHVMFSVEGTEIFLDTNKEVVLFRIVQEAITNIVKHSRSSEINIHLIYEPGYLTLQVKDNGSGFDITDKKPGAGLINMSKRARLLNGTASINSSAEGTQIIIKIPANESSKT